MTTENVDLAEKESAMPEIFNENITDFATGDLAQDVNANSNDGP